MLTHEEKKNWLIALRSGDYKQGRVSLKNPHTNAYCCLGVGAEVWGFKISECGGGITTQDDVSTYGPLVDRLSQDKVSYLWNMNDHDKKSFIEIADWIEENIQSV